MLLIWRKVISLCWLRKPIMDHQITAVSLKKHHNLSYLFKQHLAKMKAGKLFLQTKTLVFIRLFLLGYTFMTTWQPWHALKNRFACSKWTNVTYICINIYMLLIQVCLFVLQAASLTARRVPVIQCSWGWTRSRTSERTELRPTHTPVQHLNIYVNSCFQTRQPVTTILLIISTSVLTVCKNWTLASPHF